MILDSSFTYSSQATESMCREKGRLANALVLLGPYEVRFSSNLFVQVRFSLKGGYLQSSFARNERSAA